MTREVAKIENENAWQQATNSMAFYNNNTVFLGIYSEDTYEPIATSGSEKIKFLPHDIAAIVTHTKTLDNAFACIKLAGLNFACLSFGCNRMTGMSNFNQDDKCLSEVNATLYDIAHIRYTRRDSFDAQHMLNISAYLHANVVLVGIAVSSETNSILKVLQEIVLYKEEGPTEKKDIKLISKAMSLTNTSKKKTREQHMGNNVPVHDAERISFPNPTVENAEPTDNVEMNEIGFAEVQRRQSTKADIERRRDQSRRETEFCEDWRTATIRSIEALRTIGPFSESSTIDDDQKPLIPTDSVISNEPNKEDMSKDTARRASRPTMV